MRIYIALRQNLALMGEAEVIAVDRHLFAAQEAAQKDAIRRGEGEIPEWHVPATPHWKADGRPANAEGAIYYELVQVEA